MQDGENELRSQRSEGNTGLETGEGEAEGWYAQGGEGVGEGKPSPKSVDHEIPPLSKSLRLCYSTRNEKLRFILRTFSMITSCMTACLCDCNK